MADDEIFRVDLVDPKVAPLVPAGLVVLRQIVSGGLLGPSDACNLASSCKLFSKDDVFHAAVRSMVWTSASCSLARLLIGASSDEHALDEALFALHEASELHVSSDHAQGQCGEILRDIGRTFPGHPMFAVNKFTSRTVGEGEDSNFADSTHIHVDPWSSPGLYGLMRILVGFTIARPGVGYAQGMNYVAAAALILSAEPVQVRERGRLARHRSPEHTLADALSLLLLFSDRYGCADLWRAQLPRLPLFGFILSESAKKHTPLLHEHLTRIGFSFDVFAAQWLLPLCSTMLPVSVLRHVWRAFIGVGWKALLRVCVAILKVLEPLVVDADMDVGEVSQLLREWKECIGQAGKASPLPSAFPFQASGLPVGEAGARAAFLAKFPHLGLLFDAKALLPAAKAVKITRSQLAVLEERFSARVLEAKVDSHIAATKQAATAEGAEKASVVGGGLASAPAPANVNPYVAVPLLVSLSAVQSPTACQRMQLCTRSPRRTAQPGMSSASFIIPGGGVSPTRTGGSLANTPVGSLLDLSRSRTGTSSTTGVGDPFEAGRGASGYGRTSRASTLATVQSPEGTGRGLHAPVWILPSSRWLSALASVLQQMHEQEGILSSPGRRGMDMPGAALGSPGGLSSPCPPASGMRRAMAALMASRRLASPAPVPTLPAQGGGGKDGSPSPISAPFPVPVMSPVRSALPGSTVRRTGGGVGVGTLNGNGGQALGSPVHTPRSHAQVTAVSTAPTPTAASSLPLLPDVYTLDMRALAGPAAYCTTPSTTGTAVGCEGPGRTRLDCTPLFSLVLHSVCADCEGMDAESWQDASLLTAKANAARDKAGEARSAAKAAHAAQDGAELRLQELLAKKKALSTAVHEAVIGTVSPTGASSQGPHPFKLDMAAFSFTLAALDDSLAEAGAAWKSACWQATLASTRGDELSRASAALMETLVEASEASRWRRSALLVQAWRTLEVAWRVHAARGTSDAWAQQAYAWQAGHVFLGEEDV